MMQTLEKWDHSNMKWVLLGMVLLWLLLGVCLVSQAATIAETRVSQSAKGLFPANWRIVIVPEQRWQAMHLGLCTEAAFTLLDRKATYIREDAVEHMDSSKLRYVLAHEAGHIVCGCASEKAADMWAYEHVN